MTTNLHKLLIFTVFFLAFLGKSNLRADDNVNEFSKEHETGDFAPRVPRGLLSDFHGLGKAVKGTVKQSLTKAFEYVTGLNINRAQSWKELKKEVEAKFPGSRWCRDDHYKEFFSAEPSAESSTADACCNEHYACTGQMKSGFMKHGLLNTGVVMKSHCDCDRKFYQCLKEADNYVAYNLGVTYFTVLGIPCFEKNFPVTGCARKERGRCVQYEFNDNKNKRYQWFDSPKF